ncbi:unnamed protein product [Durusdinium trenchii]|uniref:Uncharacterized protein n=1 Tax=Durusdinium trenchii TaxID=1381693 RepID=A0ABP0RML8_9DINO
MERSSFRESWLETGEELRCVDRWQQLRWQFQAWFRETTDPVVLQSPWLRRSTGKALCVCWMCAHFVTWSLELMRSLTHPRFREWGYFSMYDSIWCMIGLCLSALIAATAALSRRETLRLSLLVAAGISWSHVLLRFRWLGKQTVGDDTLMLNNFVILTHCNMHPLGLLLAVILSFGMLLPPILQLQDRRPRQGRDKVAGPRQTEPRRVSER